MEDTYPVQVYGMKFADIKNRTTLFSDQYSYYQGAKKLRKISKRILIGAGPHGKSSYMARSGFPATNILPSKRTTFFPIRPGADRTWRQKLQHYSEDLILVKLDYTVPSDNIGHKFDFTFSGFGLYKEADNIYKPWPDPI